MGPQTRLVIFYQCRSNIQVTFQNTVEARPLQVECNVRGVDDKGGLMSQGHSKTYKKHIFRIVVIEYKHETSV